MKFMLTITGPFDGAETLATAEQRTMTIGRFDPAELCRDVGSWAHDVAARMLSGATGPDVDDDEDDLPIHDVPRDVIPSDGWEALIDAAA